MYPDLYLMRHGQTLWNAEGRMQGRLDSALTDVGRRQARQQAELVREVGALRISSPLGRAVETAKIVFGGRPFLIDDRLAEIDIGRFSGHLIEDLRRHWPDLFRGDHLAWYDRAPNGEGFRGLRERVSAFLADLRQPALIVTHGITLRMLRVLAMEMHPDQLGELTVEQGAVHVVRGGRHEVWRPSCR